MNDFRFTLISTFIFIVIVGLGVLAFYALEPGDSNGSRQIITSLETELEQKDEALQTALRRIAELEADNNALINADDQAPSTEDETTEDETPEIPASSNDSQLLSQLRDLRSRGVVLEPGSKGPSVGIIQQFLNAYNNTSGGVDNDFGNGTRSRVEAFQRAEGLTVDGGVGPGTLGAMISWLEDNE